MTRFRLLLAAAALSATLLAACGSPAISQMPAMNATANPAATAAPTAGMAGMDHSGMAGAAANVPYDAAFIDSMIVHHQGAIDMANQALKETKRPELVKLANEIIAAQNAEIAQMQGWRKQWYPDLAGSKGLGMDMGTMMISDDASKPFDLRFIAAMIPHHQGAIAMAKDAQQKATKPEIKQLAAAIVTAQEAEIAQMQQWQRAWSNQ